MATTATIPLCQTAPPTAFLGSALQNIMFAAAAASMMIWMMIFIFGMPMCWARVMLSPPFVTCIIWQKAKNTITSNAPRNTNTEAFALLLISLPRVVALFPYMYLKVSGSDFLLRKSGSLSRSFPLRYEYREATIRPHRHAGMVIIRT